MTIDEDETEDSLSNLLFKDFLVVSQKKSQPRPEVYKFSKGSVQWKDAISFKSQPFFDSLVLCNATVDLSSVLIDLTKTDITAQPKLFDELVRQLVDQLKDQMKKSIIKIDEYDGLLTKSKQAKTIYQLINKSL